MEDQLGALGLVVNAIALWNARYLQAALGVIEAMGDAVLEEDVARLSPLKRERPARCRFASKKFAHINMLGRYHFELAVETAGGDLRPLRDPNALTVFELPRTV